MPCLQKLQGVPVLHGQPDLQRERRVQGQTEQVVHNVFPSKDSVLIVFLFQENKSFGASYHLHSSSDVGEAVSGTSTKCTSFAVQYIP
jgi:hypothetical protein